MKSKKFYVLKGNKPVGPYDPEHLLGLIQDQLLPNTCKIAPAGDTEWKSIEYWQPRLEQHLRLKATEADLTAQLESTKGCAGCMTVIAACVAVLGILIISNAAYGGKMRYSVGTEITPRSDYVPGRNEPFFKREPIMKERLMTSHERMAFAGLGCLFLIIALALFIKTRNESRKAAEKIEKTRAAIRE